jgi:atypical dual specificity phosphatase
LCQEYRGPVHEYDKYNITQLYLPTVDHWEPSVADMHQAVQFIQQYQRKNSNNNNNNTPPRRVYVHCRAGHGRSAAIVMAWLLYQQPMKDRICLNQQLSQLRHVRTTLWQQPNIIRFHAEILQHRHLQQQQQQQQSKVDTNSTSLSTSQHNTTTTVTTTTNTSNTQQ